MIGSLPNAGAESGGGPPGNEVCGGLGALSGGGAGAGYCGALPGELAGLANP